MGIVQPSDCVTASQLTFIERAYPVYREDTTVVRTYLVDSLRELKIYCAGRFGEWLYINSDDAVMRGKLRAEEVNALCR